MTRFHPRLEALPLWLLCFSLVLLLSPATALAESDLVDPDPDSSADEMTRPGHEPRAQTPEERDARREARHDAREAGRAKRAEHIRDVLDRVPDQALPALERLTDEQRELPGSARVDRMRERRMAHRDRPE